MGTYTIGEVAQRSGFSASALRYYEGIGLVAPSTRSEAGYRLYDDRAIGRLRFISRAKQLGCSLEEIADLVDLWDGERCGPVQQRLHHLVTGKMADARRQVDELSALTGQLRVAAAQLAGAPVDGPCGPGCACVASTLATPVAMTPTPDPAIACTLGEGELRGRVDDWRTMLAGATTRTFTDDGGVRISFGPSVDIPALASLVAAEQQCCAFYTFSITISPDGVALDVRAPAGAEAMVQALFGSAE